MKKLFSLVMLFAGLMLAVGCTRIGPGHVGIEVQMAGTKRGVQDYTPTTGWVFYNPASSTVVEYPTYMQTYVWTKANSEGDESFTFNTKDSMAMNMDVNISYQLEPSKIPAFYVKFRNDDITQFTFGYLHTIARDCFTNTGDQYSVEELMGPQLSKFIGEVRGCIQDKVSDIGVVVQNFGIMGAPRPPQMISDRINSTIEAQQKALQIQQEVAQAEAEAKKKVATAEGDAQSKIAIAEGEAQANRKLAESITPSLLEWRKLNIQEQAVQKWNGQRPTVEGSSSGLLLNLNPNK